MKPIKIEKIEKFEGQWVEVNFSVGEGWKPSFEELAKILKLIGECEDEKYKDGKGADMVIEFCKDAIIGIPYKYLKEKYKLPR